MYTLRTARPEEAGRAMSLIEQARAHLREQGVDQWQDGYPDLACIQGDLAAGRGYFLAEGDDTLGYLCLDFGGEPAYDTLEGTWARRSPTASSTAWPWTRPIGEKGSHTLPSTWRKRSAGRGASTICASTPTRATAKCSISSAATVLPAAEPSGFKTAQKSPLIRNSDADTEQCPLPLRGRGHLRFTCPAHVPGRDGAPLRRVVLGLVRRTHRAVDEPDELQRAAERLFFTALGPQNGSLPTGVVRPVDLYHKIDRPRLP